MKRSLLILPLLPLAGCSRSTTTAKTKLKASYESRLALSPLPTPEAKLPLPEGVTVDRWAPISQMEKDLQNAKSPALALAATKNVIVQNQRVLRNLTTYGGSREVTKWLRRSNDFYERAAKIKATQVKQGDTTDSTGEVERYIEHGRQSYINSLNMGMKNMAPPVPSPKAPPVPSSRDVTVKVVGRFTSTQKLEVETFTSSQRQAKKGKKFVIVPIEATYRGAENRLIPNYHFRLLANKRIYRSLGLLESPKNIPLFSARLEFGGKARGNIIFEVDKDVQSGVVEYALF